MLPRKHPARSGVLFTLAMLGVVSALSARDTDWCSATLQPYVDRHELAGAVMLVANKAEILDLEAVGWADVAGRKPMTPDAIFWIASQSKPITAAALMMLVDDGRVSLDDPVEKYLPEFQSQMVRIEGDDEHQLLRRPTTKITVRHLLSHTSGLPFKSLLEEPTLDLYPLTARVRSYAMTPLDNEPGTNYRYSNAGINTAARIIEVVTSQSFEDFLDARLFQPLGMQDTSFWLSDEQVSRLAKSYKPTADKMNIEETAVGQLHYPLTDRRHRFPMPAGGLFSTAQDVSRFYRMLVNGGQFNGRQILSAEAVQELTTRQTPAEIKESYGLGFSVGDATFGHGGAYSTNSSADRECGVITIWLVQHAGFIGDGAKCQQLFRDIALDKAKSAGQ